MTPAITIAGYWMLFAGTHVGLATAPIRTALVRRVGERGFTALFSIVASVVFAALVHAYAGLRGDGAAGLGLADVAGARAPLLVLSAFAVVLAVGSFARYAASPYAIMADERAGEPRGLERVTRHAFFAAMTLFGAAHALLATRLVGTVFFAGLAVFAAVGARHQDQKLLARRGASYARYLAVTSTVPFAAILAGRQRLVVRELPWTRLAVAVLLAIGLRSVHAGILSAGGAWVIVAVVGGAGELMLEAWWRTRRHRVRTVGTHPEHA